MSKLREREILKNLAEGAIEENYPESAGWVEWIEVEDGGALIRSSLPPGLVIEAMVHWCVTHLADFQGLKVTIDKKGELRLDDGEGRPMSFEVVSRMME